MSHQLLDIHTRCPKSSITTVLFPHLQDLENTILEIHVQFTQLLTFLCVFLLGLSSSEGYPMKEVMQTNTWIGHLQPTPFLFSSRPLK